MVPFARRMVSASSSAWVGCSCAPSPALTTEQPTFCAKSAAAPAEARWRGHHRHHHHGGGGAFAGALLGGMLLGGALAAQPRYYYGGPGYYADDAVAYCMNRFKSYDPASGTYLGYDGYRHPCP